MSECKVGLSDSRWEIRCEASAMVDSAQWRCGRPTRFGSLVNLYCRFTLEDWIDTLRIGMPENVTQKSKSILGVDLRRENYSHRIKS